MLLVLVHQPQPANAFNIDANAPIFKIGPKGSYFGFSVAEHFIGEKPVILVGAPRAESGQPGTERAGAVYSCPLTATYTNRGAEWCQQQNVEYANAGDMRKRVGYVHGRQLHYQGKNRQMLGSVVASSGVPNGIAMACAPLVRYHNTSAYTDGTCFVLENDLTQKEMLVSCSQPSLPRTDRHNEFGSCMEGFSGYVTESLVITGLPGAKKWTGGVFSRYYPKDMFAMNVDRWTMGVEPKAHGVRSKLQAHDYLGYSVRHGRFGFWYEDEWNSTIVSGATRFNQTGAVIFLPFKRAYTSNSRTSHQLTLTDDSFMLLGSQMGSGFGYAIEVTDLNHDGYDDLLVGAPFEYTENEDGSFGGTVYVYYSSGQRRKRHENARVFEEAIKIRASSIHSQFGLSITHLGNVDGDNNKYNDFAIGAPFASDGEGAVYIYHGAKSPEELKTEPVQIITAAELSKLYPSERKNVKLRTFGFALCGGVDLDANGYNDLVVGAFDSDTVVVLRAKPVINIETTHLESDLKVDIDGDSSCIKGAQTCFFITTELLVASSASQTSSASLNNLLNFDSDVFQCTLEVIPLSIGVGSRAKIVASRSDKYIWACGRNAHIRAQTRQHQLYIPNKNSDWINSLKFRFSVRIRDDRPPDMPSNGAARIVDLNKYPVLNKFGSEHVFKIPFNKKCGSDNICTCDLQLQPVLPGISKEEDGTYVTQVGEKASIDISFVISNHGERAYEAMLFIEYNSDELDVPILSKKGGSVNLKGFSDNLVMLSLGNPMEPNKKLKFELSFKLARGRTEGLGKPLEFHAFVNSTSEEKNTQDNDWQAVVRVIKRAELDMSGISDPPIVRFGGDVKGETAMEFDEDIGPLVVHKYTVTNQGPWSVNNVTVQIDWPYQVASVFAKGKWALYLMEMPTIQTTNTDNSNVIKKCTMDLPTEWVNPLQLKLFLDSGSSFDSDNSDDSNNNGGDSGGDFNEQPSEEEEEINRRRRIKRSSEHEKAEARPSRELRIKSTRIKEKSGEEVEIVRISCSEQSAKCFTVTCHLDFLDVDATALIEFQSRLWNATFVEDYYHITYVEISSSGRLILDPDQGIEEDDTTNNYALASTHAYPDRPAIQETAPIPWWIIALAAALGLFILVLLILIFWKCGFFKRNRPHQPTLHQAEYQLRQEEWTEG